MACNSMPGPCRTWVYPGFSLGLFSLRIPALIWCIHRDSVPLPLTEEWRRELRAASYCTQKLHFSIPFGAGSNTSCKDAEYPLWGPDPFLIDPLGNEALCPPSALQQQVILCSSASTVTAPSFISYFFFSCFPSLSLFLSNSYLFSNLPQEISTLIGSQQNKKERKTQYLKDEYLGESISLLMSWFQLGLFAIYMSVITIHLGTAVLLLRQRFPTALQPSHLPSACGEENSSIPVTQREAPSSAGAFDLLFLRRIIPLNWQWRFT